MFADATIAGKARRIEVLALRLARQPVNDAGTGLAVLRQLGGDIAQDLVADLRCRISPEVQLR
jgi:hypothetical protein